MVYLIAKFGFIMLFCSLTSFFIPAEYSFALGAIFLFGFCGFLFFGKENRDFAALLFAAVLGFSLSAFQITAIFYPSEALDGITAEISGTITEISSGSGNPVYTIKTDSINIDGAPQKIKIQLSGWEENSVEEFDKISCEATFRVFEERAPDFLQHRSNKISIFAYSDSPMEIIGRDNRSLGYYFHLIREKISSVIYSFFIDWHAPFFEQVLIGTKGELDSDITMAFRKSGMSHILAISGMHMVIVIGLFEKLLGYKSTDGNIRKVKTVFLIVAVAFYMIIGGLGMSILRSGFMLIAHYLSRLFLSGSKSLDNLGIAIIVVLLIDPSAACDIGFLMSAVSCCAISVFAPPFKKFVCRQLHVNKNSVFDFLVESLCVSVIAFFAILPISSVVFGEISLASPFSNLLSAIFAQFAIIFGFLTVIFGMIPFLGFIAGGTAFIAMLSSGLLFKTAEFFAGFSFLYIDAGKNWFYLWLLGSALLIFVPVISKNSFRYIRHSVLMSVFVLLSGILLDFVFFSGVSKIDITPLEHGTAISCSKDKTSVLISRGLGYGDRFGLSFSGADYDCIVSIDAVSASAEHEIALASKPEIALLSTNETVDKTKGAKNISSGTLSLGNGDIIKINRESFVCFKTNDVAVLYIFEDCDIMDIEPEFRRADIIIFDGVSPEDFPLLRCDYLILRKMGGYYSGTTEIITLKNKSISFFAYNGILKKGSASG